MVPTTPFTIENTPVGRGNSGARSHKEPSAKRKKPTSTPTVRCGTVPQEPSTSAATVTQKPAGSTMATANITETRRIDISSCSDRPLIPCTASGVPLTTFSNKSLDSILNQDSEIVGGISQKDLNELRNRGPNMTVKQLLAKNFKNYKVRQSLTSELATEFVNRTLSENDVPMGALIMPPMEDVQESIVKESKTYNYAAASGGSLPFSNPHSEGILIRSPAIKGPHTLRDVLDSLGSVGTPAANQTLKDVLGSFNSQQPIDPTPSKTLKDVLGSLDLDNDYDLKLKMEGLDHDLKVESPTDAELGLDEFANQILSSKYKGTSLDTDHTAYPGNHLPWPVLWKNPVPKYIQGEIYCYVDGCTYSPMSEIIKSGKFMVPLDHPVEFIFKDRPILVTMEELLTANGINMSKAQHYRMLQGLLQKSGVHIRADYAERLHEFQALMDGLEIEDKPRPALKLSSDKLPLMCIYPDIYMNALGRRIHGAVIVDSSGDNYPLPNKSYETTVYSESLPFESRRQILIIYDAEIPILEISRRFSCTVRSVQETIGTRTLITRHQIAEFLLENPESPDSPDITTAPSKNSTIGDMMRPKSKIRRTHYVDLNKMVWRHFKDCQAAGIQINGKQLKDQAMRYAKDMGLESFRGSEGWLDAFKRRHRIDLKSMTGYPVCYENDMYEEVDKECRELDMESHMLHQQPPSFFPQSAPDEFAASFFSSLSGFPQQMVVQEPPTTSSSNHLQNMINSMMTPPVVDSRMMPSTSSAGASGASASSQEPDGGGDTIFNVMRSCQIKVADKEVSHALDTLRTYILEHDPAAMSLLVPLQERLATTSSGAIGRDMPSTSSSS
eukprot:NP_497682.2 Uncharacterized protein CELE_Y53G8AM.8 [Caenorhabditis elegans]